MHNHGMEVTVNWRNLQKETGGIFYTDANSFKMVQRDIHSSSNYSKGHSPFLVPSYYYPVTSAIYIEDNRDKQMVVMIDRPQGGSAYKPGRIELMINRYGLT